MSRHTTPKVFMSLGFLLLMSWSGMASAVGVGIPCIIYPVSIGVYTTYNSQATCASESTLSGISSYLQTGTPATIQGKALAATGMNSGLISQLGTQNRQESNLRKQNEEGLANEDVVNRALAVEEDVRDSLYNITRPISTTACYAAVSGGGAAAGGGSSAGAYGAAREPQQSKVLFPRSESDYVADMVTQPGSADGCTEDDANNKVPGCQSAGSLPGVNISPIILVRSYDGQPKSAGSWTIKNDPNDKFYKAQQGNLAYSRPTPGPKVRDLSKNTPAARQFLISQRRYNSRALAVVGAMAQVASESLSLDEDAPFVTNVWNTANVKGGKSLREDFVEIYGDGVKVPAEPSEREIMHLLVLRQFTRDQVSSDLITDPVVIARRQLDVKKINAYLLLKMNEKAEWNNILYAHILSNRIDPVSRSALSRSASAVN